MPGEQAPRVEEVNFKEKYRSLKRKMRFLIYEQECFQEELRRAQRKLLKISRDKNFLLDRLLQYERVIDPGTDSDSTLSSEDSSKETKKEQEKKVVKKKRRPKKKPAKRLQGTALIGGNRTPLPHELHSPPQALHEQLPLLAELMRKAAEGLPISQPPTMTVPGLTSPHDPQQPSLPSPHSLLSPHHHHHPVLLSPTGGLGLPPTAMPPGIDPRAFDRGLQQQFSMQGLLGMGAGPMGLGGVPQMDLNALTAAAALDKVNQEKSKKKSKKDSSEKHTATSRSLSSSQQTIPLSQASSSSLTSLPHPEGIPLGEHKEDRVTDLPDSKA
ncbi:uncharacterized protein [Diadema setosum]|uniref:uncharacterized protein n=1 Tax=Diadema setosum TaxID=31175 RepID=UPI003B3BB7A9